MNLNSIKEKITTLKERLRKNFSNDVGIDLGTANTLVHLRGKGVVITEPSVVAVNQKTGQVVAVGSDAKNMLGRTPVHISAVKPIVDGVISDFEVTQEMISYLLNKAQSDNVKVLGARVVVGVPSGITNVEIRAVRDAARNAGAKEVHIVEEPMAAAIGIGLPVHESIGSMIIDIGGGTTDIAVISLGGIVKSKNLRIAGDKLNTDIIAYVRDKFGMLIGERTAESVKISLASIFPRRQSEQMVIRGRDMGTGLPREETINENNVRDAIASSIDTLIDSVKEVLETTPPEVVSDVMKRGIYIVGGGAMIKGLDILLSDWLKIPVYVDSDPLTAVVRGTALILDNFDTHRSVIVEDDDTIPLS